MGLGKEIKDKIHGVVSLFLFGIALTIGFISILLNNLNIAVLYLFILFISSFIICYFYCLKCPCRLDNCGHIFPGKLTRIFKSKKSKGYTFIDYFLVGIVLLLLIGIPQYWVFQKTTLFFIFWILLLIALIEIRLFVCRRCSNVFCPGNTNIKR